MTKEQRHLRHEVTKAVETEHAQLQEELANSQECRDLTKTVTYNYRRQILAVAGQMPEPIFTTKQIIQLEIYAIRQPDLQERQRIESLINHAELRRHVFTPQAFDNEQRVTQQLEKDNLVNLGKEQLPDHETLLPAIDNSQPSGLRLIQYHSYQHEPGHASTRPDKPKPGRSRYRPAALNEALIHPCSS
jgi:hypothetical protein